MDDADIVTDSGSVEQFILERRIPIDRGVERLVERDDLAAAAHVVPEPIHERRVGVE